MFVAWSCVIKVGVVTAAVQILWFQSVTCKCNERFLGTVISPFFQGSQESAKS